MCGHIFNMCGHRENSCLDLQCLQRVKVQINEKWLTALRSSLKNEIAANIENVISEDNISGIIL